MNKAITAAQQIKANQGKLGVFWHTQGSGKSYSMVFFSQKVLRRVPGNWTFLIVTDREDLDGQIYRNFASTGAVIEEEQRVRAQSAEHLKTTAERRGPPLHLHPDPEVSDRRGRDVPKAIRQV